MSGGVNLVITTGNSRLEKRIENAKLASFTIGRGTDTSLFLNDPGISRHHSRLYSSDGRVLIEDTGSSGGTWVNGKRIASPFQLHDGDEIQIGGVKIEVQIESERARIAAEPTLAKPPVIVESQSRQSPVIAPPAIRSRVASNPDVTVAGPARSSHAGADSLLALPEDVSSQEISVEIRGDELIIGRDESCGLALDNLMISRRHARIFRVENEFVVEDLGSTNGTFHNELRLTGALRLSSGDVLTIGPFNLAFDGRRLVSQRPEIGAEIAVRGLGLQVIDRDSGKPKMLLDDISLTIQPRHFVGLLGTSGAGKSTFVGAVSGRRPGSHGKVLLGGENLYQRFEALKAGIGFVPQDVIFHDTLPLIEALRYTSRLRLSKDASDDEIEANLDRVLNTVGLSEQRGTVIKNLSGGQKKRVSIAMELLSQPRVLFLDEVTSGLDPRTEKQMMKLFRDLADSGITVICITHYANSVEICDRIVYLNKGLLTFFGSPAQFKKYFEVEQIEAAYDKEEQKKPAEWRAHFKKSQLYLDGAASDSAVHPTRRRTSDEVRIDWPQFRRQVKVLTSRYVRVLTLDRGNLLLLLGLPVLLAVFLCILNGSLTRDDLAKNVSFTPEHVRSTQSYIQWLGKPSMVCFTAILIVFFLSMFGSVREIVKELSIYHHERFVNLRVIPYLLSKVVPLAVIGAVQTALLVAIINFVPFDAGNLIQQFIVLYLISLCGMLAGLVISAAVNSADWAILLMIAAVIPQILFAGALTYPKRGATAAIGQTCISSFWGLEAMRSNVESVFTHDGGKASVIVPRSFSWSSSTAVLVGHVAILLLFLFVLMARKDGRGAMHRISRSVGMLFKDLRGRFGGSKTSNAPPRHCQRILMIKNFTLLLTMLVVLVPGCKQSPASQIKGSWTGPMNAVLKISDDKMILSAGIMELTVDYTVVSSTDDTVVVRVKSQQGDVTDVTCRLDGNTLRVTQSVNSNVGFGGTWTRQ